MSKTDDTPTTEAKREQRRTLLAPPDAGDNAPDADQRAERARSEPLVVDHRGGPIYTVTHGTDAYSVDLEAATCDCRDHRHREVRCKHLRRVELAIAAGRVPPATSPRIEIRYEPWREGGGAYYRCGRCGRESTRSRMKRQGCPDCRDDAQPAPTTADRRSHGGHDR